MRSREPARDMGRPWRGPESAVAGRPGQQRPSASADDGLTMEAPPTGRGPARLSPYHGVQSLADLEVVADDRSRVVAKVTQLLWLVVAARLLNVDEYAQYGYVVSIALTFCVLGDAGVGTIAGREIASGTMDPRRAVWSAVPLVIVIGSVVTLLFCVFLAVSSGPGVTVASVLAGGAFVLGNRAFDLERHGAAFARADRVRGEPAARQRRPVRRVRHGVAVAGGGVALVLGALASEGARFGRRRGRGAPRRRRASVRVPLRSTVGLLRAGLFVSLGSFGLSVCTRIPLVVLGNVGTAADVAYYTTAVRFADTALTLSITIGYGLLPGLANIQASDGGRARSLIWRTLGLLATAAALVSIPIVALRETLAEVVFGADFAAAGAPLGILMGGLVVLAVTGVAWFALLALNRERAVFVAAWIGTMAALGLSLALAQTPVGAAIAYLGGVGAMAFWLLGALASSRAPRRATAGAAAGVTAPVDEPGLVP